jgi:O-antigen polymerase
MLRRHRDWREVSTVLLVVTERLLVETKWPGCRKGAQFAAALGYYGMLCWVDRTILAPLFGYQGLTYRSPSTWTQMGVVGLILLCTALTPVRYRQPSDGVLYVLLPLVVIPVLAAAATDVLFAGVASELIITIAGAYSLLATCSMLPRPPSDPAKRLSLRQPWTIAILLSVASYGLMFTTFGVHLRLLSFNDVYGVRAAFNEQSSGATGYLVDWQANVINPLFIVYGIRSRRGLPLIAGILGDLLIYTTTGYKSVLFSALAIVAFLFALRQNDSAVRAPVTGVRLGFAFAALVAVAGVIDTFNHTIAWTSLFVRRLSLVAGVNTAYYFQYFSIEPKTHLAYGLVGTILGTTSAVPPSKQIAIFAYHSAVGNPNANLWADAYANFGQFGVILFTFILAGFLWLYDRLAQNVDRRTATVLLVAPALSLANSALLTCLLTHGMLLALLVITQYPRTVRQLEKPDGLYAGS